MPLPPADPPKPYPPAQRPAQILLSSPLAASSRMLNYRARKRPKPRMLWRRVTAFAGSTLVHVLFLFAFILGPAWEPPPLPESKVKAVHVQLIELPDLSPPPPARGTPPKQVGPVHQGHAAVASQVVRAAAVPAVHAAPSLPAIAAMPPSVSPAKVAAAPPPPPSLPQPAPTPQLQPVPLANQPPPVTVLVPKLQSPSPPAFQPQPIRAPQLEGNQPMPPPASLSLPKLPAQSPPTIVPPSVALEHVGPSVPAPAIVQPQHVALPAAPPAPELQAVPMPAQVAPTVNLQVSVNVPAPNAPRQLPKVQAPTIEAPKPLPLAAIPQVAPSKPTLTTTTPAALKVAADQSLVQIRQPAQVTVQPVEAVETPTTTPTAVPASKPSESTSPNEAANAPSEAAAKPDISTAPNAKPEGSNTATPGEPQGVPGGAPSTAVSGHGPLASHGLGHGKGAPAKGEGEQAGMSKGSAQAGIPQPGATSGTSSGSVPEYIQLKPTGDTAVMRHGSAGISYTATRFDKDWTPEGESSVDTALRHAVEKTTMKHTFRLPRGIRIKCVVMPLMPVALLGCGNANPPPQALGQKTYDKLNLPPPSGGAVPSVPQPASAASTVSPAHVVLDNNVQCAEARVTGGPPPPGCPGTTPPPKTYRPASASSSWVPASDQFH